MKEVTLRSNNMVRFFFRALKWTIIISLVIFLVHVWLITKSYLFTEESVATIARKYAGKDPKVSYKKIAEEFQRKYPGHILPESDQQWMFMNAGGWMGSMCLLHASLTEYVLFFGAAIDTGGHSGRYWANVSDTVLSGEFKQWKEGTLQANIYKPGDTILHVWGETTAVHFKENTWMVEYGRGFIPSTLGFALADTIFSTQDMVNLFYILRVYTKALYMETVTFVIEMKDLFV